MNRGKFILYLILAIYAIQVISTMGGTIVTDHANLKDLLRESAKVKDCIRRVLSKDPIPMRFRREMKSDFPCVIRMT